jgi:hypothetical protein
MSLSSTQPLTEMSTSNFHGGKMRPAPRADNFTPSVSRMSENVGASISQLQSVRPKRSSSPEFQSQGGSQRVVTATPLQKNCYR